MANVPILLSLLFMSVPLTQETGSGAPDLSRRLRAPFPLFLTGEEPEFPGFRFHLAHSAPHRGLFFYSSSASPTVQWSEPYTSFSIHASRMLFFSSDDTKK